MTEPTPACCEAWPTWADFAAWYADEDDPKVLLMPHLAGTHYRFNYCPSCGAERRSAIAINTDLVQPTSQEHYETRS